MFRPMRRKKKAIRTEDADKLLHTARRGVLAVHGDEGYPYAVPVNFLYDEVNQKLYFHSSRAGHKVDAINACSKVCFTVYGNEHIEKEEWAPFMQSVVLFGRCCAVGDPSRAMDLLRKLAAKYYPSESLIEEEIDRAGKAAQIYEITVEHISGKEVQER